MGLGGNEPVREREFDIYRDATDRRLDDLEEWRKGHEKSHDKDDDDQVQWRRWSWQQIAAWAAVAAVLVAAWIQATATAK